MKQRLRRVLEPRKCGPAAQNRAARLSALKRLHSATAEAAIMTPIIFYGTEDDTIASRTRMAKVQMLNEPVATGTGTHRKLVPVLRDQEGHGGHLLQHHDAGD